MNRQIRRDELQNGLFSSYQATRGSGWWSWLVGLWLVQGPARHRQNLAGPPQRQWSPRLHQVVVIEAGPLHESLTPPRRWERSCAAPSLAHPLTAPQARPHNHR
jgi:hypothetical protein